MAWNKKKHSDAIVLMLLGEFYEAFDDDAETVSDVCNVVLCSRKLGMSTRIPMAGFPAYTKEARVQELVNAGHRVVVVEPEKTEEVDPEQLGLL